MKVWLLVVVLGTAVPAGTHAHDQNTPPPQQRRDAVDSAVIAHMMDEGLHRSHVMETLSWLTDICGPRLTWSPGYEKAVAWTMKQLEAWGLENVHREGWAPLGQGWVVRRFSAHVTAPQTFPLLAYPKAWSPPTDGAVSGEILHLNARSDSALETFRGTLKGKFVLLSDPVAMEAHFRPLATRETDSSLLALANADPAPSRSGRRARSAETVKRMQLANRKLLLCQEEKALGILSASRGDGGTVFVEDISVPDHPDSPYTRRSALHEVTPKGTLPQCVVAGEHYNRLVRMLEKGERVSLELNLDVQFTAQDSGYNVIAEIPGTDLRDEVVMIGAHLDSWHGGTGATDNGTGVATCMEAMRILMSLNLKPRRTIRIALWGGEEQGFYGSRDYVRRHFGELSEQQDSTSGRRRPLYKPGAEKFSAYYNHDNGTGRIRGVYMQGNEALRPMFRTWLAPFRPMGASTLSPLSTRGSDHTSFDRMGLPAFQFIQDEIEYNTRTWHTTMDMYDRAQEDDLKQASIILAAFAYATAMREERLPRKPWN